MATESPNEEDIFRTALTFEDREQQSSYVRRACGEDVKLCDAVEALLRQHRASSILDAPALESLFLHETTPLTEGPGTVIGRYKLLERIGEGGMAVVYMAEQAEPIRRKVALKIIKLGMDTRQVIARFEAERQALAMMDHPSIAKVLDAGATETGRPYFVMELVTGVSITEYCDKNNLSTKDRLALFVQVCHAVQHAHQKGIIHRDIKPSNVMVTHHDGKPVPKVIDFGIAKATNQRLTEKTLFTRYAHLIGTPAYMSPEQAELSDLDIDTRTDIYSLGVLLYELLTGTTPFSEEELRKAGYIEMQRVIREQEPAKPSTRLSTLGETLTDIAKHRGCTPDLLRKAVRGDLDWIVMKALEKARERRYDNASALAIDVQRHLEDEPVFARAPGTIYHLRKFLRRHRSQTVAVLVVFAIVVPLVIAFSILNQRQRQLNMEVSLRHRIILGQANYSFNAEDLATALLDVKSILASKHVGPEARLLCDRILARARDKVDYWTARIEADPEDANNYFQRAKYSTYLEDRERASADMNQYCAILRRGWISDLQFGTPVNLGPLVNTLECEASPRTSASGLHLGFSRGKGRHQTWYTARATTDDPWAIPVRSNTAPKAPRFVPSITTSDGLELYTHEWSAEYGSSDIVVSTRKTTDDDWGPFVNLGPVVNSTAAEMCPAVSPDGLELYFSGYGAEMARTGGHGDADLWLSRRATRNDPWGEPVNLGPMVNTTYQDARPHISSDGLLLFFDSQRPDGYGQGDLYVTRRPTLSDPWGEPVNLGPVVNSAAFEQFACVSADGSTLYWGSDRPGGYGDADIWQAPIIALGRSPDPSLGPTTAVKSKEGDR